MIGGALITTEGEPSTIEEAGQGACYGNNGTRYRL